MSTVSNSNGNVENGSQRKKCSRSRVPLWTFTRAEKLQISVFLPNDLSLDDWYPGVYGLPTAIA